MKFSVVMSIYKNDKLEFIKQAFDSLLEQSLQPSEIIIVVDGIVPDEIAHYLNYISLENQSVNVLFQNENKGLAAALNIGIVAAKHNIIARMDADDVCYPERFEIQMNYLESSGVDVVGGQMSEFETNDSDIISVRKVPLNHDEIAKRMKYLNPFSHPSVVYKKEVFVALNGYRTDVFPEDYDFFVRAYLNGFKLANVGDQIVKFRLGEKKSSMYCRRRGWAFMQNEFNLYQNFYKIGFYNIFEFVGVSFVKLPVRLLPLGAFKYVYNKITR